MSETKRYYINAIHKSFGTFNEFAFNIEIAQKLACDLIKSKHFDYVGITTNYFDNYYAMALKKRHT